MGPTKSCQNIFNKNSKGQTGIEFLFLMGIMATIFVIIVLVSYQGQMDISALSANLEAQRVCHELAFKISAISSAGEGTTTELNLPAKIAGTNYTVFISGPYRSISISHYMGYAGCPLVTSGISNKTGIYSSDNFYINSGEKRYLTNTGQGVIIG